MPVFRVIRQILLPVRFYHKLQRIFDAPETEVFKSCFDQRVERVRHQTARAAFDGDSQRFLQKRVDDFAGVLGMITNIGDCGFRDRAVGARLAKKKHRKPAQLSAFVVAENIEFLSRLARVLPFQILCAALYRTRPLRGDLRPKLVERSVEFFDRADVFIFLKTWAKRRESAIDRPAQDTKICDFADVVGRKKQFMKARNVDNNYIAETLKQFSRRSLLRRVDDQTESTENFFGGFDHPLDKSAPPKFGRDNHIENPNRFASLALDIDHNRNRADLRDDLLARFRDPNRRFSVLRVRCFFVMPVPETLVTHARIVVISFLKKAEHLVLIGQFQLLDDYFV